MIKIIISTIISWIVKILLGVSARFQSKDMEFKSTIFYANHSSHIDTIAIWSSLPVHIRIKTHPIAAKDYWGTSVLKKYLATKCLNAILINRKNSNKEENPFEEIQKTLEKGDNIIIFPEGTRSLDGEIHDFKSGLYYFSQINPNIKIVPVYLENFHRSMPKGTFWILPLLCRVKFGKQLLKIVQEDKKEFLARAKEEIIQLKNEGKNI